MNFSLLLICLVKYRLQWFSQLDGIRQKKRWQIIFLKVFVKKSDFKSVEIIGKKCTQKNFSKRTISNFARFFAYTVIFLVANFSHFSKKTSSSLYPSVQFPLAPPYCNNVLIGRVKLYALTVCWVRGLGEPVDCTVAAGVVFAAPPAPPRGTGSGGPPPVSTSEK